MKIEMKFPRVKSYRDYHEIYADEENFRELFNTNKIKIRELGCDGRYWAIIYVDKRPNKDIIAKLLKKAKAGDFD